MEDNNLSIEAKRLMVLEDTCNYFNIQNRNVEPISMNCLYYPVSDKTEGCAIGRLITDKTLCKRLDLGVGTDKAKGVACNELFEMLPDNLKELGKSFLIALQSLHDAETCWTDTGLTDYGLALKTIIKNGFCS